MALKFAMIVEMINRASGPGRQIRKSNQELTKSARDLGLGSAAAARGMDRASAAGDRMRNRLGVRLFSRIRQLAGPIGMKALEKGALGASRAVGSLVGRVAGLGLQVAKFTVGAAIAGVGLIGSGVMATTAKFEQFQIMLEGTEGSAAKAKAAMAWVRQFAKKTPYELDQVMEAFVQLKAYGIDPIDGALTAAGDAAAGMSKPLMQAIEALADAQTGEFERLKEFGIRARVEGDKVTFTYLKNGKEITRQTTKSAAEMKDAITGIWSDRFGGQMDRQSKTFNGMIANLKDGWTDFLLRVGQAGVFDKVKAKLQGVLDWLNKRLDDGSVDKWAKSVSIELEKVVNWVGNLNQADLENFAGDLKSVAKSIADIVSGLGKVLGFIYKIDNAWAGVDAFVDKWSIGPSFSAADGMAALNKKSAAQGQRRSAPVPQDTLNRIWGTTPAPKMQPRAPAAGIRSKPMNPAFLRTPAAQKVPVGGSLTVRVEPPAGWSARPTKMSSANDAVPLVYRGGAMTGHS